MKYSAIVAAAVAASLGFSSVSFAQGGRGGDRDEPRAEHRAERMEHRQDRRFDGRQDRREARHDWRDDRRQDRREARRDWRDDRRHHVRPVAPAYQRPHHQWRTAQYYAPRIHYINTAPRHYYRGDVLPYAYRQNMMLVNDWNSYGLYAPPYGHQWMRSDTGEILLIALATGLIANLLMR